MNNQKVKHTPGPWYTRYNQISSLTSSHGCTIANCNATQKGITDEEAEANAALIAAAPDMLETLREIGELLKTHPEVERGNSKVHYVLCKAKAAIAKATGNG